MMNSQPIYNLIQIIKSTVLLLLKANITNSRKKSLRKLLLFFSDVNEIDLHFVNWNQQYNRSNQNYQMLIGMCYLVYKGLLTTQNNGTTKLMDFFDGQRMCRLYEKFLLEYYRKEHPELTANASQIAWHLMILKIKCFLGCRQILCYPKTITYLLLMPNIIRI